MKAFLILPLLFTLSCGVALSAEEAKDDAKPKPEARDDGKGKGKEGGAEKGGKSAEGEKSGALTGTLSEKGRDAKPGVAAVLTTKNGEKHNLLASGEQANKLAELAKSGASVRITGDKAADGFTVKSFTEEKGESADKGDKAKGEGAHKEHEGKSEGADKGKTDKEGKTRSDTRPDGSASR